MDENLEYRAGFGRASITVYEPGSCVFGWGDTTAICEGVLEPLHARAMVVEHPKTKRRIAYVCCDLGIMTESVRHHAVEKLVRADVGLSEHDVMLTATHTHSGPSGYSTYLFYAASAPGFSAYVHDAIVEGIFAAVMDALRALTPAYLVVHEGEVPLSEPIAWNRSVVAYNLNTDVEPLPWSRRDEAVDRKMLVLRADAPDGRPLGLVSWFASHGTCLHHQNRKLHPDHKGLAASMLEAKQRAGGNESYVAIFAQGAAGDITPNHRWDPQRKLMVGSYERDEDSVAYVARLESRRAETIAEQALVHGKRLRGAVDGAIWFTDFFDAEIDARFAGGREGVRTAPPRLGFGFACGTLEGPGPLAPVEFLAPYLLRIQRAYVAKARPESDAKHHGEKFLFLELGYGGKNRLLGLLPSESKVLGLVPDRFVGYFHKAIKQSASGESSWAPRSLPSQILRVGSFVIAGLPNEPTVVAGRRVASALAQGFGREVSHIAVQGYANAYAGYVTTPEEYTAQRYEGASNLYGAWSLAAFCTVFARMASRMQKAERPYDIGEKSVITTRALAVPAYTRG